jgi:twitching motility protein PilT
MFSSSAQDTDAAASRQTVSAQRIVGLVRAAVGEGASDIHLRAGARPRLRIDGNLYPLEGAPISEQELSAFLQKFINPAQLARFEITSDLDVAADVEGIARVRCNLYMEQGRLSCALRLIAESVPSMEEIYLPSVCYSFTELSAGLILVTGPTGSGKSTTLAAMIDHINARRRCHILTLEDPIEYVFKEKLAQISQREVSRDTMDFSSALRHAFRQDPDVVMIGEMRDLETMQAAITLAETGHLTFSTLHTNDASSTINRIIDSFPPHQQAQVRAQLATSLQGIISQKLVPMMDRRGRVAAREILVCTRAIRNLLREGKVPQIYSAIQTGAEDGMMTMNYSLGELCLRGIIGYEVALAHAPDRKDFLTKYGPR